MAALVFARNIVVKHRETSDGGQHEVGPARVFLKLDAAMLNPMLAAAVLKKTDAGGGFVRNPGMFEAKKVAFDGSRAALRLRGGSFAASELARATPMRVAATAIAAPSVSSAAVVGTRNIGALRLSGSAFRPGLASHVAVALPAQPEPASEPAPEPAPAPPPTTPPPTERPGEITILAFICKRVPRAPDPDPALFWA